MRRGFRWFRILALTTVLVLAGFLFYWHQTGLPEFVKTALLETLHHHGLDLQFQSLHFRWDRGLIAREVSFGRDQLLTGPRLTAGEVHMVLDAGAALRGRLQINLLRLQDGRIIWRFGEQPSAPRPLQLSHLQCELLIHESVWELRQLSGEFYGAQFHIHGVLSNALAFSRQWAETQAPSTSGPSASARAHQRMREFAHALTNYQFQGKPTAELSFQLDALHWADARLEWQAQFAGAQTPWGYGEQLGLRGRRLPAAAPSDRATLELEITAAVFSNRWGKVEQGRLMAQLPTSTNGWWNTNGLATLTARRWVSSPWQAEEIEMSLQITPASTNVGWRSQKLETPQFTCGPLQLRVISPEQRHGAPHFWEVKAELAQVAIPEIGQTQKGRLHTWVALAEKWPPTPRILRGQTWLEGWQAGHVATGLTAQVTWDATLATNAVESLTNTNLNEWQRWAPLTLQWHLTLATAKVDRVMVQRLENQGAWAAPTLTVSNLQAQLASGSVTFSGSLNAENRALQATVNSTCDLQDFAVYLPPSWQKVWRDLCWEQPPRLSASLSTRLPEGQTSLTNWWAAESPFTRGQVSGEIGPVQWRQLALTHLVFQTEWNGRQLTVPHLEAQAGSNQLKATMTLAPDGEIQSDLDWKGLADPLVPLLPPSALRALSLWKMEQPPELHLRLAGNWHRPDSWRASGRIRAAHFAFRDVDFEALESRFFYASNVLTFHEPRVRRAQGEAAARKVEADFNCHMVFLREARGEVDPMAVAQAIGPHVVKTLAPYRFGGPVKAEVSGDIPMHGELGARVDFHLAGTPFEWWRFHASNLTASVLWRDQTVTITNWFADFHGGRLEGHLYLDFSSHRDTAMEMTFSLGQIQLAGLMADISERTNRMEGLLSGHLKAHALANDWNSWNGSGRVELKDGLIWEIPIFGLFSPILNALSPGLGNSRAREARGSFVIQNSVIYTDDLVIQAAGYNLKYRGTVNFDYAVDARVEAELLRETKMVGPVLSLFFKPFTKLFEYRVTGTLAQPKTKPVYIPNIFMKLLTPFRSLRELLQSDSEPAPPAPATPPAPPPSTPPPSS